MNSDLVTPSGMEMVTKKCPRIEPSKAYEVGLGRPTLIDDCHALPVSRVAGDRLVDRESIGGEETPGHDCVAARHTAGRGGRPSKPGGAGVFGPSPQGARPPISGGSS